VIYNTEVFEVSDVQRFKEAMEGFRQSWEEAGGSDIRIFRNADKPNQVFTSMWWETAEACRQWGAEHMEEVMKASEGIVTSMEPESLWEEI
jgi:heme-degrading monooxygenase HmoA